MNFIARLITGRPLITCLVIGIVLMSVWWLKFQKKLNFKWYWAPIISVTIFIVGVYSAKFWALLEVGFDTSRAANFRCYGTIFMLPILTYLVAKVTKRDMRIAFDALTVATTVAGVASRTNCLISGCCAGLPIISGGTLRWPLVEMEILLDILLTIYFWNRVYKGKTKGLAYPKFVLIYGIFRFCIEWAREEYTGQIGIFHLAHIWSLIAIIGSAIAIYLIKKHNEQENKPHSIHRKYVKKEVK